MKIFKIIWKFEILTIYYKLKYTHYRLIKFSKNIEKVLNYFLIINNCYYKSIIDKTIK